MQQHYAKIDVSLKERSVCAVGSPGEIVHWTKVAGEPEALVRHFAGLAFPASRVGLEAGRPPQWLRETLFGNMPLAA